MSIFESYIQKHSQQPIPILLHAETHTDIVVVIPCYNELHILDTLDSISQTEPTPYQIKIVVVVNSGEPIDPAIVAQNRKTYSQLIEYANQNIRNEIKIFPILIENIRKKDAGVGFARQTGMNLAIRIFDQCNNTKGIIVSTDADTLVATDYFLKIGEAFYGKKRAGLALLNFEHQIENSQFHPSIVKSAIVYETYLRYFRMALEFTGFPWAIHTIGSAFAIKAKAYVRHGGMNKRQGGEDFYFLNKIAPNERVVTIQKPMVFPSIRQSNRVPFGTGAKIRELSGMKEVCLMVYDFDLFAILKSFFEMAPTFFLIDLESIPTKIATLNKSLVQFLENMNFDNEWKRLKTNCSTQESFTKNFFLAFDAFATVKYLNFATANYYPSKPIEEQAPRLLMQLDYKFDTNCTDRELLEIFRDIEKEA